MSFVKHAVIAAAGLGSRLGKGKPKCLVEIEGKTILSHILAHLKDVPDVRIVVGFLEDSVISEISRLRSDVIVVRNPDFRNTTTLHSYELGSRGLAGDCLYLDGDLLLDSPSFDRFKESCVPGEAKLAITETKTTDAVFVTLENGKVIKFTRDIKTEYEWANVSWLPVSIFNNIGNTPVYKHLETFLPLETEEIVSYEIDTEEDLNNAITSKVVFRV